MTEMMRNFRRLTGLLLPTFVTLFVLSPVHVSAQVAKPEEVKFCDLLRDTEKYDGRLVKTRALYSRTIDGDSLSSEDCQSTLKEQHTADPITGQGFDRSSRNAKTLSKLLKRGVTADVTITGVVHAQHGKEHGYYGVPLQVEIKELDDVKPAERTR
jgi:hypothetical protein